MFSQYVFLFFLLAEIIFYLDHSVTASKINKISSQPSQVQRKKYSYLTEKDVENLEVISSHGRSNDDISGRFDNDVKIDAFGATFRALYLLFIFSPVIITLPIAIIFSHFRDLVWFGILCRAIGNSGAAFIKWGQWSSTRPGIILFKNINVF